MKLDSIVVVLALLGACAPVPVRPEEEIDERGCKVPPPDTFVQVGLDIEVAKAEWDKVVLDGAQITSSPEAKSLLTQATVDYRLREYLRCRAINDPRNSAEMRTYMMLLGTFMETTPTAEQLMQWQRENPPPIGVPTPMIMGLGAPGSGSRSVASPSPTNRDGTPPSVPEIGPSSAPNQPISATPSKADVEPNGTRSEATLISIGSTISGMVGESDKEDWFQLLQSGQSQEVRLTLYNDLSKGAKANIIGHVCDSGGKEIATTGYIIGNDSKMSKPCLLQAGMTYYVRVKPGKGPSVNYRFECVAIQ